MKTDSIGLGQQALMGLFYAISSVRHVEFLMILKGHLAVKIEQYFLDKS